jgi:hypothetical protein
VHNSEKYNNSIRTEELNDRFKAKEIFSSPLLEKKMPHQQTYNCNLPIFSVTQN